LASKVVVSCAHQVGSSRLHISACGGIGEEVQCADRVHAGGRQDLFPAQGERLTLHVTYLLPFKVESESHGR
jgi:hypothetical protein